MRTDKIDDKEFDEGIKLFVEILKAKPDLVDSVGQPQAELKIAMIAAEFAREFSKVRRQYCGD